ERRLLEQALSYELSEASFYRMPFAALHLPWACSPISRLARRYRVLILRSIIHGYIISAYRNPKQKLEQGSPRIVWSFAMPLRFGFSLVLLFLACSLTCNQAMAQTFYNTYVSAAEKAAREGRTADAEKMYQKALALADSGSDPIAANNAPAQMY